MNYWDKIVELFQGKKTKPPIPGMTDKTSLILLLIKMGEVDGNINHFEQMNIQTLSTTIGADAMQVSKWRNRLEDVVLVLPQTEAERVDYFWRFLTLMKMDLRAHPKELEMCQELGISLGFKKKKVESTVAFMVSKMDNVVQLKEFKSVMDSE
jgi:hypothetical protein